MPNRDFERRQRAGRGQQRVHIPDLRKKLEYIPSLFNQPQTLTALKDVSGVARQTLDDAADAEAMTNSTAEKLQDGLIAKGLTFSIEWVEWRDAAKQGRDSFSKFSDKLDTENAAFKPPRSVVRDTAPPGTTEAVPCQDQNEPRPVVLCEDTFAPSNKYESALASVQPRFAQMEPVPGEVTLTFDLNCPQMFAEDERTGVKRGILVFQCGDARTTKAEERTGYPNGLEIDGVRISIRSVDQNVPSWMIESIEGNNIGLIAKVPEEFIQIVNMKPGYVISVEFCAYVKDTASTFDLSQSGDTSAAKRKIKKRLSQMSLKEGEQGSSLLAKAEMRFIEGGV